ncbi:AAA family ATPase [Prevotella sp. HUN102]|uniref:cytidylate kinase-like family protein n=1 Tax=Prevotella sp. HUN102 TaxID=1392486 RepID=UPI00048E49AA|nr:cytidylate kinase-like family protein [Prevotella sp. HUN102]
MEEKLIINVGRQLGSGGRIIAKMLAEEFNCKFYDREILNIAARESGFSEKFFEENDEQKGFLKSHFHIHLPLLGSNDFYKNDFSQESLYQFQSDAIRDAAEKNPRCVFVGRTADYVLRDNKAVVNIFITANMDFRAENVSKRRGCTVEEARKIIENGESERAKYYNYYTGKTWGHSESYDLCVDASILGLEATKDFIAEFIKRKLKAAK